MTTWSSNTYFSHFLSPFFSDDVFDEIKFTVNYKKASHGFEERLRITNLVELLQWWYSFFFFFIIETKIENYYNYVASSSDSKVNDRKTEGHEEKKEWLWEDKINELMCQQKIMKSHLLCIVPWTRAWNHTSLLTTLNFMCKYLFSD